jgi:hypothetical protein
VASIESSQVLSLIGDIYNKIIIRDALAEIIRIVDRFHLARAGAPLSICFASAKPAP